MKRFLPALLALLLLAAPVAAADYVKWSKSLEAAIAEAKERGSMIFIAMVINDEVANEGQMQVYADPAFVKASRDFVCLFCNPMANKGEVEMEIDGVKMRCSRIAPGISIRDHMNAWNDVLKNHADLNSDRNGDVKIPFSFVIDGDNKVLAEIANGTKEGGFDVVATAEYLAKFQALIRQHGKGLTKDEYDDLKGKLAEGERLRGEKEYKAALKFFQQVIQKNSRTSLADRARKNMKEIGEEGISRFKAAQELSESDPLAAVEQLQGIADTFKGTDTGKRAESLAKDLQRRPDVKEAVERLAARKAATKLLEKAEAAIAAKQYAKAISIFEDVAKKFEGTEFGDKAQAAVEELRGDPEIGKLLREQEASKSCKGWLSMGRSFAANGMNDKARELFEKVIAKFPGTSFAEQAEEEIRKLR